MADSGEEAATAVVAIAIFLCVAAAVIMAVMALFTVGGAYGALTGLYHYLRAAHRRIALEQPAG